MEIHIRRHGITVSLWIFMFVTLIRAQTDEARICQTYLTVGGVPPASGTSPYLVVLAQESANTYTPNGHAIIGKFAYLLKRSQF